MAIKELFGAANEIKVIGTRHGEKQHETLLTREERIRAEDLRDYYRIGPDDRTLNYNSYFTEGQQELSEVEDYTSQNTRQLSVPEIKDRLLALEFIQQELRGGVGCAF